MSGIITLASCILFSMRLELFPLLLNESPTYLTQSLILIALLSKSKTGGLESLSLPIIMICHTRMIVFYLVGNGVHPGELVTCHSRFL